MDWQRLRQSRLFTPAMSCAAASLILGSAWLLAAPTRQDGDGPESFVPALASEILERLPPQAAASKQDLRDRLALSKDLPQNWKTAVAMARRHYERARHQGEPRELGLARAALGPWWERSDAPVPVLQMRAAIRQHGHDFAGALKDLEQTIAVDPLNVQAWLSRASLQQTIGRLDEASHSCARAVAISDHIAGHVCLADLASLRGDSSAFDRISSKLDQRRPGRSEEGWVHTVLAEMAQRLGRDDAAEGLFKQAIAADTGSYPRVAYADLLLRRGRAQDVEALLAASPATDAVLLRRAIAFKRSNDERAEAAIAELRARFASSTMRDESLHLREMARFALDIEGEAEAALALATRNWELQKEPADALLFIESARLAKRPHEAAPAHALLGTPASHHDLLPSLH